MAKIDIEKKINYEKSKVLDFHVNEYVACIDSL